MNQKEYESQIQALQHQVETLQKTNLDLVSHNLQLSQQINAYYDVRRRIQMLKELVIRHKELIRHADLRDDAELMALIETRLEEELPHENPDFGLKELAEYIGTTHVLSTCSATRLSTRPLMIISTTYDCYDPCFTFRVSQHGVLPLVPNKQALPSSVPSTVSFRMPLA